MQRFLAVLMLSIWRVWTYFICGPCGVLLCTQINRRKKKRHTYKHTRSFNQRSSVQISISNNLLRMFWHLGTLNDEHFFVVTVVPFVQHFNIYTEHLQSDERVFDVIYCQHRLCMHLQQQNKCFRTYGMSQSDFHAGDEIFCAMSVCVYWCTAMLIALPIFIIIIKNIAEIWFFKCNQFRLHPERCVSKRKRKTTGNRAKICIPLIWFEVGFYTQNAYTLHVIFTTLSASISHTYSQHGAIDQNDHVTWSRMLNNKCGSGSGSNNKTISSLLLRVYQIRMTGQSKRKFIHNVHIQCVV